jgi:hypothetical protein
MTALPAFRTRIWAWQLRRRLARHPVPRHTVPHDALRRLAVLYRADEPADVAAVEGFAERHRRAGRTVRLLGFARRAPEAWPAERALVTRRDCGWTGIPRGAATDAFLADGADLLVGAWLGRSRPLEWLAAVHPAAWRAGEHHPDKEHAAELLLSLPAERRHVAGLLEQLDHYLPAIRLAPEGGAIPSGS